MRKRIDKIKMKVNYSIFYRENFFSFKIEHLRELREKALKNVKKSRRI